MLSKMRPVRKFLFAQLAFVLIIGAITAFFWGRTGFISVLIGGAVAMGNALGTAYAWPRILEKKDVALSLSIIVSKFALSIGIFYWLTRPTSVVWFGDQTTSLGSASGTLIAFALGLCSVVPAALVVAADDLSGTTTETVPSKVSPETVSEEDNKREQ